MQIQVSIDDLSEIKKQANISFENKLIDEEAKKRLQQVQSRAKIPGFRPGKVPKNLVEKRYGTSIYDEVIADKIKESYSQALDETKLHPVDMPAIDITSKPGDEIFSYTAVFEVFPTFELADLTQIELEKLEATFQDDDVKKSMDDVREKHATFVETEDPDYKIKNGDKITIDLRIDALMDDGQKINQEDEKDLEFTLGNGEMWYDFEKNILGHSINETVVFELIFPETHIKKDLIGKTAVFNVVINKVMAKKIPELNNEFFKKVGVIKDDEMENAEIENGEELFANKCRERIEKHAEMIANDKLKADLFEKIVELHTFEVPQVFIDDEMKSRKEKISQEIEEKIDKKVNAKEDLSSFGVDERKLVEEVRRSIVLSFVLVKISSDNGIEVTKEMVREHMKGSFTSMGLADEYIDKVIDMFVNNKEQFDRIQNELMQKKIYEFILEKIKIVPKTITYSELLEL